MWHIILKVLVDGTDHVMINFIDSEVLINMQNYFSDELSKMLIGCFFGLLCHITGSGMNSCRNRHLFCQIYRFYICLQFLNYLLLGAIIYDACWGLLIIHFQLVCIQSFQNLFFVHLISSRS